MLQWLGHPMLRQRGGSDAPWAGWAKIASCIPSLTLLTSALFKTESTTSSGCFFHGDDIIKYGGLLVADADVNVDGMAADVEQLLVQGWLCSVLDGGVEGKGSVQKWCIRAGTRERKEEAWWAGWLAGGRAATSRPGWLLGRATVGWLACWRRVLALAGFSWLASGCRCRTKC